MRQAAHFRSALVLAILAHAAALFAFGRLGWRGASPGKAREAEAPFEVGVDVESSEAPRPLLPDLRGAEETERTRETAVATRAAGRRVGPSEPGSAVPPLVTGPSSSDTAGESWTFSPSAPTTAPATSASPWIGLRATPNGASSFRGGGPAGRDEAPPPSATGGAAASVRAALEQHDFEIGLGMGGPLVSPTRDAVRTSLVPDFSHATLEFTTDEAGLVVSVRVLDANSDVHVWDEVAQKITKDARKKPLRVPPGAQGVAVTVQVESKMVSASGHDLREGALGRVLGGLFEPTDLLLDSQEKAQRVVLARVVSERRL